MPNMPALDIISTNPLFPPKLREIVESAPMPGLDAEPSCPRTGEAMAGLLGDGGLRGSLAESALWLLAGELDRSHGISQADDSPEAAYWHGIMHRREGDFSNAKYWFRRVGRHPVLDDLAERVALQQSLFSSGCPTNRLRDATTLAPSLVDLCQTALASQPSWRVDLQRICWWEWQLLFLFTQSG
jgi:hypothetical protein